MIKNCLGLTLMDFKRDLLQKLDLWLLRWLLSMKCGEGGPGEAGISNFGALNAFFAKSALDHLDSVDRRNGRLQGDSALSFVRDNADRLLEEFSDRECMNGNEAYKDVVKKPGALRPLDGMFPSTADNETKKKLVEFLAATNFGAAGENGMLPTSPGNTSPYIVGSSTTTDGYDLADVTDSLFGDGPLKGLTAEELQSVNADSVVRTKCFRRTFYASNYVVPDDPMERPIWTDEKLSRIQRVHEELLVPIHEFYYGAADNISCRLRIHGGVTSIMGAVKYLGSSLATRHIMGDAVNFSLVSVPKSQIIADLSSGAIGVEFGVVAPTNGIYLTLPYEFEGHRVSGVVLDSPKFDASDIRLKIA